MIGPSQGGDTTSKPVVRTGARDQAVLNARDFALRLGASTRRGEGQSLKVKIAWPFVVLTLSGRIGSESNSTIGDFPDFTSVGRS
jgi:hypothetical protein